MSISLNEQQKDFFKSVFEVVKLIPEGRVTSYGAIAAYLSSPRSSRMVGWAMNASHRMNGIPAHRVVNRNGMLSGKMHFSSPTEMSERLQREGIIVKDDKIVNFQLHFWDPSKELELK